MSDDSLKNYLRKNAQEIPEARPQEAVRIWNRMQQMQPVKSAWRWWVSSVMTAAAALIAFVYLRQPQKIESLEEEHLYREWTEMVQEVDADFEQEYVSTF
ncbi:MAG: hypothetical protein AAGB31_11685 [Bdellovibrio sp.]